MKFRAYDKKNKIFLDNKFLLLSADGKLFFKGEECSSDIVIQKMLERFDKYEFYVGDQLRVDITKDKDKYLYEYICDHIKEKFYYAPTEFDELIIQFEYSDEEELEFYYNVLFCLNGEIIKNKDTPLAELPHYNTEDDEYFRVVPTDDRRLLNYIIGSSKKGRIFVTDLSKKGWINPF